MVAYELLFTLLVLPFSFPEIISPLSLSLTIIMDRSTTCSCFSCDNRLNFICHIVGINALSRTTGHLKKKTWFHCRIYIHENKMYNIRFRAECVPKSSYSTGCVKGKTQTKIKVHITLYTTFKLSKSHAVSSDCLIALLKFNM